MCFVWMSEQTDIISQCSINSVSSRRFCSRTLLTLTKKNTDTSPARVNIECPDDRYSQFDIYISELMLDSYEYIPVAYITMN
jgi:hypothetical protein